MLDAIFFFQMGYVWNRVLFSCDDFISGFMPEMQNETLGVQHDPRFPGGSRVVHRFQVHTNGNFQEVESLLDSNRFFFFARTKMGNFPWILLGKCFFLHTLYINSLFTDLFSRKTLIDLDDWMDSPRSSILVMEDANGRWLCSSFRWRA